MTLRCYIVDNEDHAINLLSKFVGRTPTLELVGTETNPLEAMRKLTSGEIKADVSFLDIEMPQLSGLDLAALIQPYTHIVFTTAHQEFALKSFDTEVIDYLLKPIEYPRFLKAVQKIQRYVAAETDPGGNPKPFVFIQSETKGKYIRIKVDDIYSVEGAQNYVRIHLDDIGHLTYMTLKEMEEILPKSMFLRIHKSYLININKVSSVEGGKIHLSNGVAVQLGPTYKKEFLDNISTHLIQSSRQSG